MKTKERDPSDIDMICDFTGVSKEIAMCALDKNFNDMLTSIMWIQKEKLGYKHDLGSVEDIKMVAAFAQTDYQTAGMAMKQAKGDFHKAVRLITDAKK